MCHAMTSVGNAGRGLLVSSVFSQKLGYVCSELLARANVSVWLVLIQNKETQLFAFCLLSLKGFFPWQMLLPKTEPEYKANIIYIT